MNIEVVVLFEKKDLIAFQETLFTCNILIRIMAAIRKKLKCVEEGKRNL